MTLTVPLPDGLEKTMSPSQARLHLAIGAFAADEATLGQAAEIAEVSQTELMRELSRRRISLHYGSQEFQEDLLTISRLKTPSGHGGHQ
jgi:predicted HTH domain antitoxin